jgi:mannan endo-1,4-beta-mannosidase
MMVSLKKNHHNRFYLYLLQLAFSKSMQNHIYRFIIALSIISFSYSGSAQTSATLHAKGNNLIGICGDTITLHGIDYAPYNWGYDSTQLYLNEIAQTSANAVRLVWYANSTAPYYTYELLDTAIHRCIQNKMIPILELHDLTCSDDYNALLALAQWYTSPQVTQIISAYQSSLIINIANEVGYVSWDSDPTAALQTYKNTYDSIVQLLRNSNIGVPVMIDAPDCGTNIAIFDSVASTIINNDPLHNVLFSAHAYWYAYANNDSLTMLNLLTNAQSANYPLVLGEIANYQDDTVACQWALEYTDLLHICHQLNIGWMAWSWNNDVCAGRQLSNNGLYNDLSAYGNDIVNNANYGLSYNSKLTTYLYNSGTGCTTTGIENIPQQNPLCYIYYENGLAYLKSQTEQPLSIQLFDLTGRNIEYTTLYPNEIVLLAHENMTGLFLIRVITPSEVWTSKYTN